MAEDHDGASSRRGRQEDEGGEQAQPKKQTLKQNMAMTCLTSQKTSQNHQVMCIISKLNKYSQLAMPVKSQYEANFSKPNSSKDMNTFLKNLEIFKLYPQHREKLYVSYMY